MEERHLSERERRLRIGSGRKERREADEKRLDREERRESKRLFEVVCALAPTLFPRALRILPHGSGSILPSASQPLPRRISRWGGGLGAWEETRDPARIDLSTSEGAHEEGEISSGKEEARVGASGFELGSDLSRREGKWQGSRNAKRSSRRRSFGVDSDDFPTVSLSRQGFGPD